MGKLLVIYGPSTAGKTELQKVIRGPSLPSLHPDPSHLQMFIK